MAWLHLRCPSCGANLEGADERTVIECSYCGATHERARWQGPPTPTPTPNGASGSSPLLVTLSVVALVMISLGFYAWSMLGSPGVGTDRASLADAPEPSPSAPIVVPEAIPAGETEPPARTYGWRSGKVIVADVDDDGIDDVIGMITEGNQQIVRRVAISGSDGEFIWETEIAKATDVPAAHLSFDVEHRLVLMTVGTEVSAFELATGERRWTSHFSDKVAAEIIDGERLFVATKDERITGLQITDGTSLASDLVPSAAAFNLPRDWSMTQTPLSFRYTHAFRVRGSERRDRLLPDRRASVGRVPA
jgi:hypothetical protein